MRSNGKNGDSRTNNGGYKQLIESISKSETKYNQGVITLIKGVLQGYFTSTTL